MAISLVTRQGREDFSFLFCIYVDTGHEGSESYSLDVGRFVMVFLIGWISAMERVH